MDFFHRRNEYIQETLEFVGDNLCEIDLPKCRVILMRGIESQIAFFNHRALNLEAGYLLLHPTGVGDWRDIKGMPSTSDGAAAPWFYSRFATMMRGGILLKRYPLLLSDIHHAEESILNGPDQTDIFKYFHLLVLQLIIRVVCPKEISEDPAQGEYVGALFGVAAGEATVFSSAFPWIPGVSTMLELYYGSKVYTKFQEIVKHRQTSELKDPDVVDFMIEKGDTVKQMISFLLGATFAGLINTSRTQGWLLIYLWAHPEWKIKIEEELHALIAQHSVNTGASAIQDVPLEAWGCALPSLEACVFEILRLKADGALLRQNLGDPITVEQRKIESERFVSYLMSDVHHNPLVHPDPTAFNPARKPANTAEGLTFVGFGAGRHPCPGKELVLLLTKLIISNFLLTFDYEIVDEKGSLVSNIPASEKNSLHVPAVADGQTVLARFKSKAQQK